MNTQMPPVQDPERYGAGDAKHYSENQRVNENPFAVKAAEEAVKPKKEGPTVITGKRMRPIFCVVAGAPGVGKSTFAAGAPKPIFLDLERGVDQIGADRFTQPESYAEFMDQLHYLSDDLTHGYKTIVIDTIDALDALIIKRTCEDLKVSSIEIPQHGAGYTHAKGIWRSTMTEFKTLSERFNIVLIGHVSVQPFNDPSLPAPYDTWRLRMNQKCADVIKEGVDLILYACLEITVNKNLGLPSGRRVFHSKPAPGYEAKQRFNLADPLDLEWAALREGVKNFYQQK